MTGDAAMPWSILTIAFLTDFPKKEELAADERVIAEGIPFPALLHGALWRRRTIHFRFRGPLPSGAREWLDYQKSRSFIVDWSVEQAAPDD